MPGEDRLEADEALGSDEALENEPILSRHEGGMSSRRDWLKGALCAAGLMVGETALAQEGPTKMHFPKNVDSGAAVGEFLNNAINASRNQLVLLYIYAAADHVPSASMTPELEAAAKIFASEKVPVQVHALPFKSWDQMHNQLSRLLEFFQKIGLDERMTKIVKTNDGLFHWPTHIYIKDGKLVHYQDKDMPRGKHIVDFIRQCVNGVCGRRVEVEAGDRMSGSPWDELCLTDIIDKCEVVLTKQRYDSNQRVMNGMRKADLGLVRRGKLDPLHQWK